MRRRREIERHHRAVVRRHEDEGHAHVAQYARHREGGPVAQPDVEDRRGGSGIEDFLATELATLDGKLFGVPWSADTFALAYRPDLLAAAWSARPSRRVPCP